MTEKYKYYISYALWPILMAMSIVIAAIGFESPHPMLGFNIAYVSLIISLLLLERSFPHEKEWQENDRQLFADIAHTLTSKATVQALLIFGGVIGLTSIITPLEEPGTGIWPRDWPVPLQVLLALITAEFGLYWAHRMAHEWPLLWRFHAIHHSVTRLWIVNTGRFHFIDSLISIVMAVAILLALGAPLEIVRWQAALTAFFGLLTHCNVEMRFGPLNYIFVTPGIHRWHHSMKLAEGNKNYGENLVIWDIVFGSYINSDHRPPKSIGVPEYMPPKFIHQLVWPFLNLKHKQAIKARYPDLGEAAKAKLSPAEKRALEVEHNVELSSVIVPNRIRSNKEPQAAE